MKHKLMKQDKIKESFKAFILSLTPQERHRQLHQEQNETIQTLRCLSEETLEIEAVLLKARYKYRKAMGRLEMFMAAVLIYIVTDKGFLSRWVPVTDAMQDMNVAAELLTVYWTVGVAFLAAVLLVVFVLLRSNIKEQSYIYRGFLLVELVRNENKGAAGHDLL